MYEEDLQTLIKKLNKYLWLQDQYKLDNIYSVDNNDGLIYLGKASSIYKDLTPIPWDYRTYKLAGIPYDVFTSCIQIVRWINNKIFTKSLHDMMKGFYEPLTLNVRLRIAVNRILRIEGLSEEQKEEWLAHLHNLFYTRTRALFHYYDEHILKLPF